MKINKIILTKILIHSAFIIFTLSSEVYDLVTLNSTSALCLDGSSAAYYISRAGDSNKILLFFEGGGWCLGENEN
jgi:hypothetical protein